MSVIKEVVKVLKTPKRLYQMLKSNKQRSLALAKVAYNVLQKYSNIIGALIPVFLILKMF